MTIQVKDMAWSDLQNLVKRRLNKLAMCKRGAIETDINKQQEALGNRPQYTKAERESIRDTLAPKIRKASTLSLSDIKKCEGDYHKMCRKVEEKMKKVMQDVYIHPDEAKWENARRQLQPQRDGRIAACDADFQDAEDSFILQIIPIEKFRETEVKLEAMEW